MAYPQKIGLPKHIRFSVERKTLSFLAENIIQGKCQLKTFFLRLSDIYVPIHGKNKAKVFLFALYSYFAPRYDNALTLQGLNMYVYGRRTENSSFKWSWSYFFLRRARSTLTKLFAVTKVF